MRKKVLLAAVICSVVFAGAGGAQNEQTLADIRQELNVLYVEIQKLRRELSTTGAPSVAVSGDTVLDRVTAIEGALSRLTSRTEQLEYRIERIVQDGTNRIGDLEFRLVELEGGDLSQLGETTTLGGEPAEETVSVAPDVSETGNQTELAIGEQADFDTATAALNEGRFRAAIDSFAAFTETYPGSPLAPEADLRRGEALEAIGDTREAARAFLASFSADPTGPVAADALTRLGASLGALGQVDQACVTLGEVSVRFPLADAVADAQREMDKLGCA